MLSGGDKEERWLYRSDEDSSCLEEAACRFALGFALLCAAPLVICWNECQQARLTALYNAAQRQCIELADPNATPSSAILDGKFVCFSGRLSGECTLRDDLFPFVRVERALLLIRIVEIYQYVEFSKGKGEGYRLEEQWCKAPARDPPHFPQHENTTGNWAIFSDNDRMMRTGDTWFGEDISFGDNAVIFRAPNPSLGAFALPPSLMNQAFLGDRHVHRLGELEQIQRFQGHVQDYDTRRLPNIALPCNTADAGENPLNCFVSESLVYDGDKDSIGTLRFRWQFVRPQSWTIAAEAVAPGRPCTDGYGMEGRNVYEPGAMGEMIRKDWRSGFKESLLSEGTTLFEPNNKIKWKITPFSVFSRQWYPPFEENFLGRLWLHAPGRLSSRQLFFKATLANFCCALTVRFVTYLLLLCGWLLVFEPLTNLKRRPLRFLNPLLALAFGTAALVLATVCWTGCTALACLSARPFQSILVVAAAVCTLTLILHKLNGDESDDTTD